MIVKANAKINLTLDITGKREDGYHTLDTVMQSISLYDEIDLTKNKDAKIILSCSRMSLPLDERNTAYRAARLILDYGRITDMGVNIHICKEIPSEAGLGGGSADAAAVLQGLNELFRLELSEEVLLQLAVKIGADVPFCLLGGTKRCMGIGEILSPLPPMPSCTILICKPPVGVKTPYAYSESDKYPQNDYFWTPYLKDALISGDIRQIAENIGNRFDDILHIPEVQIIKSLMLEAGALNASMTGSGSAVFGIFSDQEKVKNAASFLKQLGLVFVVEPRT
ncbi:MAG: 4-(cytidine 5'-diphospho)-2-C-methyl-D-erythritol kinase [Oscillospiraceae bacterium]